MSGISGALGPDSQIRPQQIIDVDNKNIDIKNDVIPLKYSYVVVGNHQDVSNAIQGINFTIVYFTI